MLGQIAGVPIACVHFSRNWSTEVWSDTSEVTQPPRVHGEMRISGTRKPKPTGSGTVTPYGTQRSRVDELVELALRRDRRRDVVELAVVLVVVDDDEGRVEHLRVGIERGQEGVQEVGPVCGRGHRVLREELVVHDPAHLRQRAVEHVGADGCCKVVGVGHLLALIVGDVGDAVIVERVARGRRTALVRIESGEGSEVLHAVVAVVVFALVHVPAQPGVLQCLPVRLPGQEATEFVAAAVGDDRAVLLARC